MKSRFVETIDLIRGSIQKNETVNRLVENYDFRTVIFSTLSLATGIGFAIFNIAMVAITNSLWCGAMACYHILLSVLRGKILHRYYRTHKLHIQHTNETLLDLKQYRLCGIVFIFLTFCLAALIIFIVRGDKVFTYRMYVVYTASGYAIFQISVAAANYIRAQKSDDYSVRALRCINLVSALVSFISVQAVTLDTFSTGLNIHMANAITGFVISGLIIASGVYMIVHSERRIKALSENQQISVTVRRNIS